MGEEEFQRALIIVLLGGSAVVAIGTGVLYLAFRRVGRRSHFVLIGALVAFLFACCVALFALAFAGR